MSRKMSGIIFIDHPPILTDKQIEVISEIFRNVGTIIFAATIVPFLIGSVDSPTPPVVAFALIYTFLLFVSSVMFVRNIL